MRPIRCATSCNAPGNTFPTQKRTGIEAYISSIVLWVRQHRLRGIACGSKFNCEPVCNTRGLPPSKQSMPLTYENLKFGAGSDDWKRFFQLVGALHARTEKTAPIPNVPGSYEVLM